jgi:hypothetical protein
MHIFVADEHLLMVANTRRHAVQIPCCAGLYDIAYGWRQKGEAVRQQVAAVLRFLNSANYKRQGIVALPCAARTRRLFLRGFQAAATARATWSVSDVSVAGAAQDDAPLRDRPITIAEVSGCPVSAKARTSRGQPGSHAAAISNCARLFTCSAANSTAAAKLCGGTGLTCLHEQRRENIHAIPYHRVGKRSRSGFVVFRSAGQSGHNPYHLEPESASGTRYASSDQGDHSGGSADQYRKLRGHLVLHGVGWTCRVR